MQIPGQYTYRNKIAYYFICTLLSFVILLLYNVLLTSIFSPVEYGKYRFVLSFLTLGALIFDGGLFTASAFDLASSDHDQRQRLGTIIVLTGAVSLLFVLFIAVSGSYIDIVLNKKVKTIIFTVLPLAIIVPFHEIINYVFQGLHKITYLAVYKLLPRLIALGLVFFLHNEFSQDQNVAVILMVDLLCGVPFIVYLLARCKPSFKNFKSHFFSLIERIKQFGFKIYISTLFHSALGHATIVITSLFLPMEEVGIYTAAIVLCTPVLMTGKSFGVVLYKYFAVNRVIKKQAFMMLIMILIIEVLVLHLFRTQFVSMFFSQNYIDIVNILPFIALSLALQSIANLFYVYFTATGDGQPCLNMNVFFWNAFLLSAFFLAPEFKVIGVAVSLVIASIVSLLVGLFYAHDKIKSQSEYGYTSRVSL